MGSPILFAILITHCPWFACKQQSCVHKPCSVSYQTHLDVSEEATNHVTKSTLHKHWHLLFLGSLHQLLGTLRHHLFWQHNWHIFASCSPTLSYPIVQILYDYDHEHFHGFSTGFLDAIFIKDPLIHSEVGLHRHSGATLWFECSKGGLDQPLELCKLPEQLSKIQSFKSVFSWNLNFPFPVARSCPLSQAVHVERWRAEHFKNSWISAKQDLHPSLFPGEISGFVLCRVQFRKRTMLGEDVSSVCAQVQYQKTLVVGRCIGLYLGDKRKLLFGVSTSM